MTYLLIAGGLLLMVASLFGFGVSPILTPAGVAIGGVMALGGFFWERGKARRAEDKKIREFFDAKLNVDPKPIRVAVLVKEVEKYLGYSVKASELEDLLNHWYSLRWYVDSNQTFQGRQFVFVSR